MVTVGEVIHRFELFINDANACFVGADGDILNVLGRLSLLFELGKYVLGSFD